MITRKFEYKAKPCMLKIFGLTSDIHRCAVFFKKFYKEFSVIPTTDNSDVNSEIYVMAKKNLDTLFKDIELKEKLKMGKRRPKKPKY